jgi:nucleotide-binding universal stress UspA family protein
MPARPAATHSHRQLTDTARDFQSDSNRYQYSYQQTRNRLGRRAIETDGGAVTEHLKAIGATFLVMGAYGHSRLGEFVLGGTTRDMLEHPPVPVFLSR